MMRLTISLLAVSFAAADHMKLNNDGCNSGADHWVGVLPFFNGTDAEMPCSYAGTLASNSEESHHMFYWLYQNEDDDAPLIFFLNGGPGASSMFSNFILTGPMGLEYANNSTTDYDMYVKEHGSWADLGHMVYIDQPVGTGMSWGDDLLTTMDEASDEFITFLDNFYLKYPAFQYKDLYFTGESYAGKYLPRFSYAVLKENEKRGEDYFNLQATLIGDPYTAPLTQRTNMHILPSALNTIDDSNMSQIAALERRCQEILAIDLAAASDTCASIMDYIDTVSGNVFPYDQRIFAEDWAVVEDPTDNYFTVEGNPQSDKVFQQLHVDDSTKVPIFEMDSSRVGTAFVMDNLLDYSWYVQELIAMKSPVMIYAGEFDAQDGPKTQEFWLRKLDFDGNDAFWSQSRSIYYVQADEEVYGYTPIVGGYWRSSDYFNYITIPKAGHFVPNTYYEPTFQFMSDYINYKALQCHAPDSIDQGCSVVQDRLEFMNFCTNGQGQPDEVTGQCVCNLGYKGADCSLDTTFLYGINVHTYNHTGPKYFSFTAPIGFSLAKLRMESLMVPMDIYITNDVLADPNQFSYQVAFKGVNATLIDTSAMTFLADGFSVTVYIPAVDELNNELINNEFLVSYEMVDGSNVNVQQ